MEQEIQFANKDFDFSNITISQPVAVQGGAYFTKIRCNNNPLYIQTLKCLTKQGLNETNKKAYVDLKFTNEDDEIIEWFETLETKLIELIYSKKEVWFQNDMDKSDIENSFNPITRAFKGGKFHLVRVNIPKNKTINSKYFCTMYDETETMIPIQELNDSDQIIPILEIQGIKFSARSFQVEVVGKQIMLLNNKPIFNSCLIKKNNGEKSKDLVEDNQVINSSLENHTESLEEVDESEIDNTINENIGSEQGLNQEIHSYTESLDHIKDTQLETGSEVHELETEPEVHELETESEVQQLENDNIINELLDDDVVNDDDVNDVNDDDVNDNNVNDILNDVITGITNNSDIDSLSNITHTKESNYLEEVSNNITINDLTKKTIRLKKPNEVYYEIYKITKEKANQHKKAAIAHYLEAKKIKNSYLLEDMDHSDDSSDDELYKDDTYKIKEEINDLVEELS